MSFEQSLTLTELSRKGWELAQVEKRNQHNPVQITSMMDRFADAAVVLHAAGNSRAISLNIFRTNATPAAVEAAITALV